MRPFALWVTTLLAVAVPPAPARATAPAPDAPQLEPGAPPLATQRYQNGRRLYAAGDLPGAAAEFRSALTLWPTSPKLAFNLARTLERQGELGEAVGLYRRYLELSPTADDRATVSALATALEARVEAERPRFVISALPEGTEVFLDEVMVGRAPLTVATTPGEHVIRFKAPGHQSVLRTLTAERGKTTPMAVQLERAAPGSETAGDASAEEATGPRSDPAWRAPLAYAALGLGAVGLGLGAYFTAAAAETADEANGLGPGRQARFDTLDDRLSGQKAGIGRSSFSWALQRRFESQDPLSNRACGFPAHGLRVVSRTATLCRIRSGSERCRAAGGGRGSRRTRGSTRLLGLGAGFGLCVSPGIGEVAR